MTKLLLSLTLALTSLSAFADFNTPAASSTVTCQGAGIVVQVSADRRRITVRRGNQPTYYDVVSTKSDGDTTITYEGQMSFAHFPARVYVTFSDLGDQLTEGQQTIALICP